ncbi:hypothetical protein [Clostridium sp.]|uniref:hypothetical protein n=1 Tax=Clostridium sp. TaxID=1506 RepID=UPI001B5AD63A|nr:hypothetical protein [Clostridium sp.]MBP3917162.1 hypothetical protein [Clostridium sp.]
MKSIFFKNENDYEKAVNLLEFLDMHDFYKDMSVIDILAQSEASEVIEELVEEGDEKYSDYTREELVENFAEDIKRNAYLPEAIREITKEIWSIVNEDYAKKELLKENA